MAAIYAEIRAALDADLLYLAVVASASIPDVCANLELASGHADNKAYRRWFKDNVGNAIASFNEDECYELRCGVLHRGATKGSKTGYSSFDRFAFLVRNDRLVMNGGALIVGPPGNRTLCIDARDFCEAIIASAEKWEVNVAKNATVQANMDRLIRRRPEGLPPHLVNVPVVA